MKKIFASLITGILFMMPAFASAASLSDIQTQLKYILAQIVALSADQPVSCSVFSSTSRVKVGEQFTFLWYSTGANSQTAHGSVPKLDSSGVITMALSAPGTWNYTLKFYDAAGAEVPCTVNINVVQ